MTEQKIGQKLRKICKECFKYVDEEDVKQMGDDKIITLSCGHLELITLAKVKNAESLVFADGKVLKPFQVIGVNFARESGFRAGIFDDTGLGKTIQALACLLLWPEELLPCAIVVKSALKYQWFVELMKKCGLAYLPNIVEGSWAIPNDELQVTIFSYDILRNLEWLEDKSYKTVILDECQAIKNPSAKRTKYVRDLVRRADHLLALSATPIKNNADEFYPVLNMLRPGIFNNQDDYRRRFVAQERRGPVIKWGGLKYFAEREFRELTAPFIIRRTREEVAPELPPIVPQMKYVTWENAEEKKEWDNEIMRFAELHEEMEVEGFSMKRQSEISTSLMRLRHIVGDAKVSPTVKLMDAFMDEDVRKVALFCHHHSVTDQLYEKLIPVCEKYNINNPMIFDPRQSNIQEMVESCANIYWPSDNPKDKILIASTLSAGEGLNLQSCADGYLVERQFNPANEIKQVGGRFSRFGATHSTVFLSYVSMMNSIDEWFAELVAKKDAYVTQTLDGGEPDFREDECMKDLYGRIAQEGRRLWKMRR